MRREIVKAVAFITRCPSSAMIAYEVAHAFELPEALWAAMSAVIVSQEHLHQTRSSIIGRILGTLLGIGVTVAVGEIAPRLAMTVSVQMFVAVALTASIVRRFPTLRVAMWTCPIILLTGGRSGPIVVVALNRGTEVILGALIGWAIHWAAEILVDTLTGTGSLPDQGATSSAREGASCLQRTATSDD